MEANKQLIENIYSELAKGNSRPLVDSMADDVRWTIKGTTKWSLTFNGKEAVLKDLLRKLRDRFAVPYKAVAHRIIAEGDCVVAEVSGRVTTKAGLAYNNDYCFVYRIVDGKIVEINEYMDTELATAALGDPDESPRFLISNPEGMATPRGYSHVVEITRGKIVQLAGQVALDADGSLVGLGDFRAQVEQVFKNIKTALEAAGGTCGDIVKLNCYCVASVNAEQLPAFREVRDHFVNVERPPISTLVFVTRLVQPQWLVEIEATAVL